MMKRVSVHEAKTHLSRLLTQVALGKEVIITNSGSPVAKLIAYSEKEKPKGKGRDVGKVIIAEDFNAPLPKKLQRLFNK
jgi:prevent-host-death family protein